MLNPDNAKDVPLLIAVFGWIRKETLDQAKDRIRKNLPHDQSFMLISWVGENKEGGPGQFKLEGWIWQGNSEFSRQAFPKLDDADYWYIQLDDADWTRTKQS